MCSIMLVDKVIALCTKIFCCKPRNGYKYVQYEDDTIVHNNVLYDMRNIDFGVTHHDNNKADRQWRDCDLYEEK